MATKVEVSCLRCGKAIPFKQGTCPHCGHIEFDDGKWTETEFQWHRKLREFAVLFNSERPSDAVKCDAMENEIVAVLAAADSHS